MVKIVMENKIFVEMKIAIDINVRLFELGVKDEIIAEATGLSLLDIQSLKS